MVISDQKLRTFLFSYHHDGASWSLEVQAVNEQEAKARVAKMAWAKLDGEVFGTIPVRSSWPARATVWLLNRLSVSGT